MMQIGLLSDTHGYLHPKVFEFFKNCDEIWHAGDAGKIEILDQLEDFTTLQAVYGNIDGHDVRIRHPEYQLFDCEDIRVLMIHIGGYPKKYNPRAKQLIEKYRPGLFITGHSHILKVMYDSKYELLHINPGAAGKQGLHKKITFVRFSIDRKEIKDLEIFETGRGF